MTGGRRVYDLEQPRFAGMPVHASHQPGYSYFLHRRHGDEYAPEETGPRTSASGLIVAMEHSGTHIDALCHQSEDLVLHGGVAVDGGVQSSRGFSVLGVEETPPLVAPAVLLDVAAGREEAALEPGYVVTAEDLERCRERQGVEIHPGEVVLVRTGNGRYWREAERYLAGPGMGPDASRYLADRGVLAVGADNMAWDVIGLHDPELGCELPGHLVLLVRHGVYIVENLYLEELAAAREHRTLFVCTPLKLSGATGSPVRPIAIASGDLPPGSQGPARAHH